jgi:hypothetical protein
MHSKIIVVDVNKMNIWRPSASVFEVCNRKCKSSEHEIQKGKIFISIILNEDKK